MKFRYATAADRQDVEFLWSYCFEPKGDPFFDYYFSKVYRPEETLVAIDEVERNGQVYEQIVADVHLRPYRLQVRQRPMEVAYIVGVATHPAFRRGGVGGQLLRASLDTLRHKGHAITILMPSKAGFYQPYGWELYCHQWVRRMALEDLRPLADRTLEMTLVTNSNEFAPLASVYEGYTTGLTGYALRSDRDWRRLIGSLLAEGVNIAVAFDEGAPVGYLFYRLGAPEIVVSEMVYTSRKGQKALLGFLYNHRSQGTSVRWHEGLHDKGYLFYPDGKEGNCLMPFMMGRIVDTARALEEIPFNKKYIGQEEVTITFDVTDPLCPWNEGLFAVTYSPNGAKVHPLGKDEKLQKATFDHRVKLSVNALVLMLMGRLDAVDLVYEDRLQGDLITEALLEGLYPARPTYINEWY